MEVHAAGGGINYTVRHVQQASEEDLYTDLKGYLHRMLKNGTTLAEVQCDQFPSWNSVCLISGDSWRLTCLIVLLVQVKSGYGLTLEAEVKMLRVIHKVKQSADINIDISSTYCGAHSVPV